MGDLQLAQGLNYGTGEDWRTAISLDDFQRVAKQKLPKDLYEYVSSGSDDEQTLGESATLTSSCSIPDPSFCPFSFTALNLFLTILASLT